MEEDRALSLAGEVEVIRIGAEAVVSKLEWNGLKLVSKHRVPKPYRMPELCLLYTSPSPRDRG